MSHGRWGAYTAIASAATFAALLTEQVVLNPENSWPLGGMMVEQTIGPNVLPSTVAPIFFAISSPLAAASGEESFFPLNQRSSTLALSDVAVHTSALL